MAKKWINPTRNENGGKNKPYTLWCNIMKRNEVCEEWHNYDNFYKWYIDNYKEGWKLQKDPKSTLSPSTCRYIPQEIEDVENKQNTEQISNKKVIDNKVTVLDSNPKTFHKVGDNLNTNTINLNSFRHVPLVQFKDKCQLRFEAYNRMMINHPDILCHATFSELFSIEVFRMAILRIKPILEKDGLYKQAVKANYNKVMLAFDKYISKVYENCYDNDEHLIRELIQDLEMDITKMYFSIKNHLDRNNCNYSASLSILMTCIGLNDLVCVMQNEREKELRKIEKHLSFMDFMKPIHTINPLKELTNEVLKNNRNGKVIDLNEDPIIKLAIRVIDTKVNSNERVNEIINNIYKNRK